MAIGGDIKTGKRPGRLAFQPTDEQRVIVKRLAAIGIPQKDISYAIGISEDTLGKYFRNELNIGPVEANEKVGTFLYLQAQENLTAAIFWAKTRMGWRETNRTELTGADGEPLQRGVILDKPLTEAQWAKLYGRESDTVGAADGTAESSD